VNVAVSALTRPANRCVTSCTSQFVAVGIVEGDERSVTAAFRIRTAEAAIFAGAAMEYLAHVDAARDEPGMRSPDIVYDEVEARRRSRTELNRAWRARRRELYGARPIGPDKIGVEPPAKVLVEALGAIEIRNGNDRNFELRIESCCGARRRYGCHGSLIDVDEQVIALRAWVRNA
jgi:hypothetical protein